MCRASTSAQTHKQSGDNKEAGKPKERGKGNRDIKAGWTAHRHTLKILTLHTHANETQTQILGNRTPSY